jgi:hypothetical protein
MSCNGQVKSGLGAVHIEPTVRGIAGNEVTVSPGL